MLERVFSLLSRAQQAIHALPTSEEAFDPAAHATAPPVPPEPSYSELTDHELRTLASQQSSVSPSTFVPGRVSPAITIAAEAACRAYGYAPTTVQRVAATALLGGRTAHLPVGEDSAVVSGMAAVAAMATGEPVHLLVESEADVSPLLTALTPLYDVLDRCLVDMTTVAPSAVMTTLITTPSHILARLSGRWWEPSVGWPSPPDAALVLVPDGRFLLTNTSSLTADPGVPHPHDVVERAAKMTEHLKCGRDYTVDRRLNMAMLTDAGIHVVDRRMNLDREADDHFALFVYQLSQAMLAAGGYERGCDYDVADGDIVPIDAETGCLRHGRRFRRGLHEALQRKEKLAITSVTPIGAAATPAALLMQYHRAGVALCGTQTGLSLPPGFPPLARPPAAETVAGRALPRWEHTGDPGKFLSMSVEIEAAARERRPVLGLFADVQGARAVSDLLTERQMRHTMVEHVAPHEGTMTARVLPPGTPPMLWVYDAQAPLHRAYATPPPDENAAVALLVVTDALPGGVTADVAQTLATVLDHPGSYRYHCSPDDAGELTASPHLDTFLPQAQQVAAVQAAHLQSVNALRRRIATSREVVDLLVELARPELERILRVYLPELHMDQWDRARLTQHLREYLPAPTVPDLRQLRRLSRAQTVETIVSQVRTHWDGWMRSPAGQEQSEAIHALVSTTVDITVQRFHGELHTLAQHVTRSVGTTDAGTGEELLGDFRTDAMRMQRQAEEEIGQQLLSHITQLMAAPIRTIPITGTVRYDHPKVGRNDPCSCGSGKKHKRCCGMAG